MGNLVKEILDTRHKLNSSEEFYLRHQKRYRALLTFSHPHQDNRQVYYIISDNKKEEKGKGGKKRMTDLGSSLLAPFGFLLDVNLRLRTGVSTSDRNRDAAPWLAASRLSFQPR